MKCPFHPTEPGANGVGDATSCQWCEGKYYITDPRKLKILEIRELLRVGNIKYHCGITFQGNPYIYLDETLERIFWNYTIDEYVVWQKGRLILSAKTIGEIKQRLML